jgi:hypothetical protein
MSILTFRSKLEKKKKGLVNLAAAEPLWTAAFGAGSESKHADCDQALAP